MPVHFTNNICDKVGDRPDGSDSRKCVLKTSVIFPLFSRSFSNSQWECLGSLLAGVFFSCGEFQWWAVPEGQMLQSTKAGSGIPSPVGLVPLRKSVLGKWCEDWFGQADCVLKCTFGFLKAWKLKLGMHSDHRRSGCPDWGYPLLFQGIDLVAASLTYWDLQEEKLLF